MTAQAPEKLDYRGRKYGLIVNPLEYYFEQNSIQPKVNVNCTACYRGYIGSWKIKDLKLYLKKLCDFDGEELSLKEDLFPDAKGPVLADWYTGPLICPYGEIVDYIHAGYSTTYERYLVFDADSGEIRNEQDLSLEEYFHWYDRLP